MQETTSTKYHDETAPLMMKAIKALIGRYITKSLGIT